jgi:FkbM family methyltransferase
MSLVDYNTKYGKITLYSNEKYIGSAFRRGSYWDEPTLLSLKKYIDPTKNILEIGGHCGTSTIVYSTFLNADQKVYVYEPQKNMYDLIVKNVGQNGLSEKILPYNKGVFCYTGKGKMNNTDLDGGGGNVQKRYREEANLGCNFGGISLGGDGEPIELITVDDMALENIGFIHCDAQGSENYIFAEAKETLRRCRPVILFEDNERYGDYLYNTVKSAYPEYEVQSKFDLRKFCMEELGYKKYIEKYNGSIDELLLP